MPAPPALKKWLSIFPRSGSFANGCARRKMLTPKFIRVTREMNMQLPQCVSAAALACVINCAAIAAAAHAEGEAASPSKLTERDGQHDFDFDIGVWQTHIKRVLDPLSGSADSVELNGTVTVRKVWDGRAQLEEIEADGPNGHWEGLSLFLYNPEAHQWGQSFSNSKSGVLVSPMIGRFKNGRGSSLPRTPSITGAFWCAPSGPTSSPILTSTKSRTQMTAARRGRCPSPPISRAANHERE